MAWERSGSREAHAPHRAERRRRPPVGSRRYPPAAPEKGSADSPGRRFLFRLADLHTYLWEHSPLRVRLLIPRTSSVRGSAA